MLFVLFSSQGGEEMCVCWGEADERGHVGIVALLFQDMMGAIKKGEF